MPFTSLLMILYISAFVIGIIGFYKKLSLLKVLAGILLLVAVALTVLLGFAANNM